MAQAPLKLRRYGAIRTNMFIIIIIIIIIGEGERLLVSVSLWSG